MFRVRARQSIPGLQNESSGENANERRHQAGTSFVRIENSNRDKPTLISNPPTILPAVNKGPLSEPDTQTFPVLHRSSALNVGLWPKRTICSGSPRFEDQERLPQHLRLRRAVLPIR